MSINKSSEILVQNTINKQFEICFRSTNVKEINRYVSLGSFESEPNGHKKDANDFFLPFLSLRPKGDTTLKPIIIAGRVSIAKIINAPYVICDANVTAGMIDGFLRTEMGASGVRGKGWGLGVLVSD